MSKKPRQISQGQRFFWETDFPHSDEHVMRLANKAVAKANISPNIMSYDECLSSALYGIANGWKKYKAKAWQSSFEWLLMQAYYQIKTDAKTRLRTLSRETEAGDRFDLTESPKTLAPHKEIENEESAAAIVSLLNCLSKRDRDIVSRITIGGETYKAVAKRFRMKRSEVVRRYAAALEQLREAAEKNGFSQPR